MDNLKIIKYAAVSKYNNDEKLTNIRSIFYNI